jgi:hypothetical protein
VKAFDFVERKLPRRGKMFIKTNSEIYKLQRSDLLAKTSN